MPLRLLHSLVVLPSAGSPGVTEDPGRRGSAPAVVLSLFTLGLVGDLCGTERLDVTALASTSMR